MQFRMTIVRHGETDWNKNHIVLTYTDQPLNETGRQQASLLGKHLQDVKYTKVYTSGLMRTNGTAEGVLVASKHPLVNVVQDARLTEKNLSEALEGTSGKEFWVRAGASGEDMLKYLPPGGESYEAIRERAAAFFRDLCTEISRSASAEENVLIVTHGLLIMHLLDYFYTENSISLVDSNDEAAPETMYRRAIANTATANLEVIQLTDSTWKVRLLTFNDTTHLA